MSYPPAAFIGRILMGIGSVFAFRWYPKVGSSLIARKSVSLFETIITVLGNIGAILADALLAHITVRIWNGSKQFI